MAMEALGAPPIAIKELKALISVMMGKVMPTPVRAAVPISGDVPNVDAVHNVVEHVHHLGGDGGHR